MESELCQYYQSVKKAFPTKELGRPDGVIYRDVYVCTHLENNQLNWKLACKGDRTKCRIDTYKIHS